MDFPANNSNSASFKSKTKITGKTENDGTKDVKIIASLNISLIFGEPLKCH